MNTLRVGITALLVFTVVPVRAADPADCNTFTWDMTHELALFGGSSTPAPAAISVAAAPQLEVNKLYSVALRPLADVTFAHAPGKRFPPESGSGGVLKLRLTSPGSYRISVEAPLWIDVVATNGVIESTGFQGQQVCHLIHKSVAWTLPAGEDLVVQLAGTGHDRTMLAVTPVPSAAGTP